MAVAEVGSALPEDLAKEWMTLEEAKAALKVGKTKLYELKDSKRIRHRTYMNRAIFSRASIAVLLGSYKDAGPKKSA